MASDLKDMHRIYIRELGKEPGRSHSQRDHLTLLSRVLKMLNSPCPLSRIVLLVATLIARAFILQGGQGVG